jgi:alpha-tubulin suppressor-like RCC1 family protein
MRVACAVVVLAGCNQVFGLDDLRPAGDGGADSDAGPPPAALALALGGNHTCVLLEGGAVRCWGRDASGQLGLGAPEEDLARPGPPVTLRGPAVELAAGGGHTCARFADGTVTCWGTNNDGQLGYGHINLVGDNEPPASAGTVAITREAQALAVGGRHTCARLTGGAVRCWGFGGFGALGAGNPDSIGNDEPVSNGTDVGGLSDAAQIAAGFEHSCALTTSSRVLCWGEGANGRLGYGNTDDRGEEMTDLPLQPLPFAGASAVTAGREHTCALFSDRRVLCWGDNDYGQLGTGDQLDRGGTQAVDADDARDLGLVAELAAGHRHTCARYEDGEVRCWGDNSRGQLGIGTTDRQLDAAAATAVLLPAPAIAIDASDEHTCAILVDGGVSCWGAGDYGKLGLGDLADVGATPETTPMARGRIAL